MVHCGWSRGASTRFLSLLCNLQCGGGVDRRALLPGFVHIHCGGLPVHYLRTDLHLSAGVTAKVAVCPPWFVAVLDD
jgi:hypothetical protein